MFVEMSSQRDKSYGLVFIQSEGIRVGLDVAFHELFFREVSQKDIEAPDFSILLKQMFERYLPGDLDRILRDLQLSNVILSLQRDAGYDRVWDINYAGFSQSVYYEVLRTSLKGDFKSYLIESDISDQEMEWFLKNLKGDKRIISADEHGRITEIQRHGKERARGLRSLVTNSAYDVSAFETLSSEQQKEVVVRFVHTSDNLAIVLDSLKVLTIPPLLIAEIQEIDRPNLDTKVKIKRLAERVRGEYDLGSEPKGVY